MAPRKRNPAPKPVRQTPADGTASSRSEDLPWIPDPKPPSPEVKAECERALTSLRRGNHTKALRLMKEACGRHESSALLHRVHGTVSVKVASLLDDPAAKLRHLRAGVESARRAAALSPSSVEFAHFHATLLYEAASDGRGYEEVVQECERALSVSDPVDPAVESLQEESQQKLATPEARISHVQQELRALIQKSNIASISTWMKNLGNGVGGEEKFRLIPMRRLSEDPMEVRIVPSRRPNEIKKANKTPEERRKEIEVRVAAARLIQQKPDSSPNQEDPSPSSSSSSSSRRKLMNSRKVTSSGDRTDQVRSYWNSMTIDQRLGFLIVGVPELKAHFALSSKEGFAVLSEALSFVEANGTWEFWACCRCDEKSTDCDSHTQHVVREHTGSLSPKFQSVLPQEVDAEWIEMLIGGSWRPVDASAAVKMLEDEQLKFQTDDSDAQDKDCPSEYWSPKENSDSSTSSSPQQQESEERSSCNGFAMGNKKKDGSNYERWPLSDDTERAKLLERIQGMFQSLVKHKSLSVSHLNKVIQFAMEEIQSLPSGSLLMNHALDQSPICIHFLGASQLRKVLKFLQELSQSCGLGRYSEKDNTIVDAKSVASKARNDPLEGVSLVCDSSSLFLGGRLFHGENAPINADSTHLDEVTESVPDTNALISWLFTGPPSGEQLVAWTRMREESSHQGMEILQMLEKEFYLLQSMCERKCEHLSYEEALQAVENLCVDEFKKREHAVKFTARSYESVLRKRQEELIERENEVMFVGSRFELDAISNVLKEAQAFNASQFGYDETLSGMTSRLCELESGEDDEWRVNDFLHQADTCIEVAIQRQKEHLIVELSKIDARIMRNVNGMQQLELKLGPASAFDYRTIVLPLLKSFLRVLLEDLVDKDATEKSDAAREAFLAELALDAKKNGIKGVDPKQIQEKPKDKKKNKDYKKSKDIKAMGFNEDHILHQESQECEFLDDADLIESKLIETGDCSGQHEVEFNRKVELEAEERKLEETLEYQRRIEDEAKQKHLAELFKNGPGTYQDSVTKEASVVGSDLSVGYQGPWGKLSYHNQASLHNDTSAVCLKGLTFGDFHCSEAAVHQNHQNVEFEQSENSLVSKDPLQNVEPQNLVHHNEESYATYTDDVKPFGQNIRVPSTSEGLKLNGIERTQGSARSFSSSSQQKNKSTSSYSKHNQAGTFGNLQEGFGLSEQRASRQSKKRSSSKVHDGNAQSSPHELGDNRANTLEKLPAEDDDEERFQADLKKAVRQSLDTFQAQKKSLVATVSRLHPDVDVSGAPVTELASISSGKDVFGTGLRNAVGEYNCFLNVIIQSLWHIRRFRDEFLRTSPLHVHVGNPCVVCSLYDIFTALTKASEEAVSPTCLRIALSNLYPDSNFFQEAQMNDASEVLAVIFDCLHKSFTSSGDCDMESDGSNCTGRWDCSSTTCIAHTFFGMDIYEQMNCNICGLESRHMKYTSFFHNINANALRTMKITCADSSFDELLKNVEMNHQVACDLETGGCGNPNYIHHILSSPPHVFTTVLGWQNMNESAEDISATLTALNTEVEIGVLYRGLDQGIKHSLVSLVCYYGQHYHCFAYENDRWVMYDDQTVKAIGSWGDVLTMCERGHLQPQVLFYESHN